jgi:hypothetical protein
MSVLWSTRQETMGAAAPIVEMARPRRGDRKWEAGVGQP